MLNEDQVRELLRACEAGVGHSLDATRGNLGSDQHRAAAIWALLVLDAVIRLGRVEYERPISTPNSKTVDVYLHTGGNSGVWIEAAYLVERFVENERRSDLLRRRFHEEGQARGVPGHYLWARLDGESTLEGFRRRLPVEQELSHIFRAQRIQDFFAAIQAEPRAPVTCDMRPDYTATLGYDPTDKGWSGGLVEDVPQTVNEHGVYRKLKQKAEQHRGVPGPYLVCLGSDRSPALRLRGGQTGVSGDQAVSAALARWQDLSAVLLVSIEAKPVIFSGITYSARSCLYLNSGARHPLTSSQVEILRRLDFNRWRYSRPHDPWKLPSDEKASRRHSGGRLVYKPLPNGNFGIEIPAWLVLAALLGSTNVIDAFELKDEDFLRRVLKNELEIENVRMVQGDVARGDPPRVALELRPDFRIFDRKLTPKPE